MIEFLQIVVLFAVIFDPPASFAVFLSASKDMNKEERNRMALLSILVAVGLSLAVLLFGEQLLLLFSTDINEFRVAGGIILSILGIKMALGMSLHDEDKGDRSSKAIAAIIGTPLLTGPAAITAIIMSVRDSGLLKTGAAVGIVLLFTAAIFFQADRFKRLFGRTAIQIISTVLGLITLAWGVRFVSEGIHALF